MHTFPNFFEHMIINHEDYIYVYILIVSFCLPFLFFLHNGLFNDASNTLGYMTG
jgi:hypothetical protein